MPSIWDAIQAATQAAAEATNPLIAAKGPGGPQSQDPMEYDPRQHGGKPMKGAPMPGGGNFMPSTNYGVDNQSLQDIMAAAKDPSIKNSTKKTGQPTQQTAPAAAPSIADGLTPLGLQSFYQQAVAPYMQFISGLNNQAIDAYQKSMNANMNLPYMKNDPVARSMMMQVPMQVKNAQVLNNDTMGAMLAAPEFDKFIQATTANQSAIEKAIAKYNEIQGVAEGIKQIPSSVNSAQSLISSLFGPNSTFNTSPTSGP